MRVALRSVLAKGLDVVIIIDEAHRLTGSWLEDVRMLVSIDMDSASLATLILVAIPTSAPACACPCTESLWSRIDIRYQLKPLTLEETAGYIAHHLHAAGHRGSPLFSDGFIAKAFEYTRGVPRRINQLCTYSLLAAKATATKIIDEAIFQRAQLDLDENTEEVTNG